MADCGTCTKQRGTYIPDFVNAPPNQMAQKSDEIKKKRKHEWGRRVSRLLKKAPMLGKENCYKYFRISLKMGSFTSNNTL